MLSYMNNSSNNNNINKRSSCNTKIVPKMTHDDVLKVVFHSRLNFFLLVRHKLFLLHCIDHQVTILITPLLDTLLWTSNSENCGIFLKKDSYISKTPGYMKQSLIQPTMMMLCLNLKKDIKLFTI